MSSAFCVFIHASETGHAEGVPIAPSRGRSVEVPFGRELVWFDWIKLNLVSPLGADNLGRCEYSNRTRVRTKQPYRDKLMNG